MDAETLRALIHYDPQTGSMFWRRNMGVGGRIPAGAEAGTTKTNGYRCVRVGRKNWLAHRLAWLYVHGRWPIGDIDHINGVRADNRLCNLREATRSQNIVNSDPRGPYPKGVSRRHGRWCASLCVQGKRQWLGTFDFEAEAVAAVSARARELYGEFVRLP